MNLITIPTFADFWSYGGSLCPAADLFLRSEDQLWSLWRSRPRGPRNGAGKDDLSESSNDDL